MDQQVPSHPIAQNRTGAERKSDRELVITRLFDAAPRLVFRAWAEAALFRRWWVPDGFGVTLLSCEMDVRTGGTYKLVFAAGEASSMEFFGKYLDVVPGERIVWTNEEEEDGAVTTVTFEDQGGKTLLTYSELYATSEALEEAMVGSAAGLPTQLDQLEKLLPTIGT